MTLALWGELKGVSFNLHLNIDKDVQSSTTGRGEQTVEVLELAREVMCDCGELVVVVAVVVVVDGC